MTYYYWDEVNDNLFGEEDENGEVTASYTHEPGLYGELIALERNGETRYYNYDGLGNTAELTDENCDVTDTYEYSAFGEEVGRTGTTENPFGYKGALGYYTNGDTNDIYVRARTYEPTICRWVSPDPTRFVEQMNRYSFSRNSPVEWIDPSGAVGIGPVSNPFVSHCYAMLWGIQNTWKWTNPCAAALLGEFLSDPSTPRDSCPKVCHKAVVDSTKLTDHPIHDCFTKFLMHQGFCGKWERLSIDLRGSFAFEKGDQLETELYYAFHGFKYELRGLCDTFCGFREPGQCCCRCMAGCSVDLIVTDTYDFCSTAKSYPHPTFCACLIERLSKGRVFAVHCETPFHTDRAYTRCPGPAIPPTFSCNSLTAP